MKYAIVKENEKRVIDIIDSSSKPFFPSDSMGGKITAIPLDFDSEVEIGMSFDFDTNTFYKETKEPNDLEEVKSFVLRTVDELRQEGANAVLEELQKRGVLK